MGSRNERSLGKEHDPDGGCGLFDFKGENGASIYSALASHQVDESWPLQGLISELHRWTAIFNDRFGLGVPEVALGIDRLRPTRLGHFRYNHNAFALRGEIIIYNRFFDELEGWRTLGTLLHELLHGWQQAHGTTGRRNYHNKQFREKAARYGLIVDQRGYTEYAPDSLFLQLLAEHGVNVPRLERTATPPRREGGQSTLRKWTCGCTNVRVAVRSFQALCLSCNRRFEPSGW